MARVVQDSGYCSRKCRAALATWAVLALAAPHSLHAQSDSVGSALRLTIAAGPAFSIGRVGSTSATGYMLQGSVSLVQPATLWRLRGDIMYQHAGALDHDMRSSGNGSYTMSRDATGSAAALLSALFTIPNTRVAVPYLIAGIGVGLPDAMTVTSSGAESSGAARVAWQGGAGLEWGRGGRAVSVEARIQSIRAAVTKGSYTTVPVMIGVSF